MFEVQFSIMVHYPSLVAKDCITLAVLFFNKTTKESKLVTTKKWDSVRLFNDALDIDLIKFQLEGIDEEIHQISAAPNFELYKYTKFFQNALKFTDVTTIKTDDFNGFIQECSRQYLIRDIEKSKRPTKNEQLTFIKKYLKTSDIQCENKVIKGYFNENIAFDFVIKDYAFKFFRFEGKKESKTIKYIKDWAYDALKLKNKYKFIFITDLELADRTDYPIIYKILEEECYTLLTYSEVLDFIKSIATT